MSSLDEDSFGWTTTSNDSDIMHSDDDNHNSSRKKTTKRKIKEKAPNDSSTIETLENEEIKDSDHGSLSPSILIKNETEANITPSSLIKKSKKHKSLSSTVVYNNEVSSDVSVLNVSKKKAKKNKKCTMWDDTQLNETSEIDNQSITTDLELSAISKNVDIKVKGESLVINVEKKSKKQSKSENLINLGLKTDENLNHAEHSLESYENTEDAAEELRAKKLEKRSKKKLKHNNVENIGLTIDQGNFEDDEISPKKKKRRNVNFITSALTQDDNKTVTKNANIDATSDNNIASKSSDILTEIEGIQIKVIERHNSSSSYKNNHNIDTNMPHIHYSRTSSSDSLVSSEIKNADDIKLEEHVDIETNDNKSCKKNSKHNHKLKKSVTVVSDEIPFENQVMENEKKSSVQEPKDSKLLLQYILKNKNLKPIKSKLAGDSFLTEDDDIWIMKCPIEINIKSLYDSDLVVDNKCKLKINNQVYQGILNNSKINVAMPYVDGEKFIVKNCLPKGVVRLRKRIPKPHFVQDAVLDMNPHSIPLPETKLRHPLFGFDYKSYVKLPSYVTEKLQNLESTSVENHNINKKKKRKKIEVEIEPVRKSKKRKFSGESDTTVVKTKKKKHKISTEEMWESEKAIEEHLFNL